MGGCVLLLKQEVIYPVQKTFTQHHFLQKVAGSALFPERDVHNPLTRALLQCDLGASVAVP